MIGFIIHAEWWQGAIALVLYIAYLYHILIGGLQPKPYSPRSAACRTIVYFAAVLITFDGIDSTGALHALCFCIAIALIKGIILGFLKKIEKRDDQWMISHDKTYVIVWICIYALKLGSTILLKATGNEFHLWFTCLYYAIMSTVRSAICYKRYRDAIHEEGLTR